MPTSPRMRWSYPAEGQNPFFESFESMIAAQDASVFSTVEDRNVLVMKGGILSFNALSGLLSWTDAIELNSAVTGFLWSIASSSITMADGDYLFLRLARNPITNTTLTLEVASKLPSNDLDRPLVLGIRRGDRIYFRDGKILIDSQSVALFSTNPTGGATGITGQKWRSNIALTTNESNNTVTPLIIGTFSLDADDYTLSGTNTSFTFKVLGNVTGAGVNATVLLYNLTSLVTVATVTFSGETVPTEKTIAATISTSPSVYEVRCFLTGGVGTLVVQWAGIQVDNTLV
jgi:hypothetical protein